MKRAAVVGALLLFAASATVSTQAHALPETSVRAQASPAAPTTSGSHTGPGLNTRTGKDSVSARAVRGIVFLVIALAVVGWLFRLRVRDWMLGRERRPPEPPGPGSDGRTL